MNLFSSDHQLSDYALYFDLDVIIHKDLSPFIKYEHDFCSIRDFKWYDTFNSSIMFWKTERCNIIWDTFCSKKEYYNSMKGDQDAITEIVKERINYYEYPDDLTWSWKWGQRRTKTNRRKNMFSLNRNARVCVFHDSPKPWEISKEDFNYTLSEFRKAK
jgi:hypothetical protein